MFALPFLWIATQLSSHHKEDPHKQFHSKAETTCNDLDDKIIIINTIL